jgi:hypothetical protein
MTEQIDLIRIVSGKNRSALRLAEEAHRGVRRKGTDFPYLLHPVQVAEVLAGLGADRDVVCAGCLHDVVEDTDVTLNEIREKFGGQVAELVAAVTKTLEISAAPLEEQAPKVLELARSGGPDGVALKGADLLVNGTDLVLDAEEHGIAYLEGLFREGRALPKLDHYLRLADLIAAELDDHPLYRRLSAALRSRFVELRLLREQLGTREAA